MSRKIVVLIAFACFWSAGFSSLAIAQEEAYSAIAQTSSGTGGKQVQFNFTITKWSTQDEIKQLGAVLKEKGQDALLDSLKKLDAGRIRTLGDTGSPIAIAEKWQDKDETVITLILARQMTLFESKYKGRTTSTDYPFGFLQVRLDAKGEGKGKAVAAAKIKYDKEKDSVRLDPYGNGATPIINVRPNK
jgi:hypothetical protein